MNLKPSEPILLYYDVRYIYNYILKRIYLDGMEINNNEINEILEYYDYNEFIRWVCETGSGAMIEA